MHGIRSMIVLAVLLFACQPDGESNGPDSNDINWDAGMFEAACEWIEQMDCWVDPPANCVQWLSETTKEHCLDRFCVEKWGNWGCGNVPECLWAINAFDDC